MNKPKRRSPTSTHYRVGQTSSSIAFGKLLSWETLESQKAHRCLGLTDLSLGWNSQQLVIIYPKGTNRKTKLELKTCKSVIIIFPSAPPPNCPHCFVTYGTYTLAAEEVERQMPASFLALKSYHV